MKTFLFALVATLMLSSCSIKLVGYQEESSKNITMFSPAGKIVVKNGRDIKYATVKMYGHDMISTPAGFRNGSFTHVPEQCSKCSARVNTNPRIEGDSAKVSQPYENR